MGVWLPKKLRNRAVQMYRDGDGCRHIAGKLGCSHTAVLMWVRAAGLKVRSRNEYNPKKKEQAVQMYQDGMSGEQIAIKLGCSGTSVRSWVAQAGGTVRPRTRSTPEIRAKAIRMYKDGMSSERVGAEVGFSPAQVLKWIKQAGITVRSRSDYFQSTPEMRARAVELYEGGKGLVLISREVGFSESAVRKWLKAAGVKMRVQPFQLRTRDDPTSPWAEGNDW